jgi:hypothetical protein
MRTTIISLLIGLVIVLMVTESLVFATNRFSDKYPYGLLTDDFGILSEHDLERNTEGRLPEPFDPSKGGSYAYWQCFPIQQVTLLCDGDWFEIVARDHGIRHKYLPPHIIGNKECVGYYQKNWRRLTRNQSYVCLSGPYTSFWKKEKKTLWAFEKFKTKKGCFCYFEKC